MTRQPRAPVSMVAAVLAGALFVGIAGAPPAADAQSPILEALESETAGSATPTAKSRAENALEAQAATSDRIEELEPLVDQRVVRSNLRHGLDQSFREHGISIAFPQRDVHLDAARPIPVRVVREAGPEEGGGA